MRILGRGRAGGALARALSTMDGWQVEHQPGRGPHVASAASGCDVLVLAVPDGVVGEVAGDVAPHAATLVVHLAGSLGLDVLSPHPRCASFHPLVPLTDPASSAARLRGCWVAVAGDPAVQLLVEALDARPVEVADVDRAAYHAAAVMASNHLVALLGQVERVARSIGVPLEAYLDLSRAALDEVAERGPAAALTGPVSRVDWVTVRSHLAALPPREHPAYLAMAAEAARLAGRALPPDLVASPPSRRGHGAGGFDPG